MDLDEIRSFVAVVETRSFVAAARSLGFARATLRRRVEELEARAGVSLLDRTPTGVNPTPAGEVLAKRGRQLLDETQALLGYVREIGQEPSGVLRIVVPVGLPPEAIPLGINFMRARFPKLTFDVRYAEDPLASQISEFDIALHWGARTPDGPWISYEMLRVDERLVASVSYLERAGIPAEVADLAEHPIMLWRAPVGVPNRIPLLAGGTIDVEPMLVSADIHHVRECVTAGLGIAFIPEGNIVRPGEEATVTVLPKIVGRSRGLRLVVPRTLAEIPKIRGVVEAFAAAQKVLVPDRD